MIAWQDIFSRNGMPWKEDGYGLATDFAVPGTIAELKAFLDAVHVRHCLVRPYQTVDNYPVVEARELLPSFDNAMIEHKSLPGFSMVAFGRQLDYFREPFQYDILHDTGTPRDACLLERQVLALNMQTFLSRLPRCDQEAFRQRFAKSDLTDIALYPSLTPHIVNMDRGHVLSLNTEGEFFLSGIFASFTNDIDIVLKRFGLKIGKFSRNNSDRYARNRQFVYQFLMELYGFPIVSERRTSAAMFARKLNLRNEDFLLRVLGQTDRTITTYTRGEHNHAFPKIEKLALVAVDEDQEDALQTIAREGFFLDEDRRVVILRVTYRQHRYDPANPRQDRALSVAGQEILHPLDGRPLKGLNIIRDATNMYLRLNDIVHGEYTGHVVYTRNEIIESTETDEKRLKVLYYWLSKHQRRMIDYSDDFFGKVNKVLTTYLFSPENDEAFGNVRELYIDVCARLGYIQQARRVRLLEELRTRNCKSCKGGKLSYREMIQRCLEVVTELKFELVHFFPEIVENVIACLESITSDPYLIRRYIRHQDRPVTKNILEVRKGYGALVAATDEFRKVLRNRQNWQPSRVLPRTRLRKEKNVPQGQEAAQPIQTDIQAGQMGDLLSTPGTVVIDTIPPPTNLPALPDALFS